MRLLSSDRHVLHTGPPWAKGLVHVAPFHDSDKDPYNANSHLSGPARRRTVQMWLTESWTCRSRHGPPRPRRFPRCFGYRRSNLAIIEMRTGHGARAVLHQGVGFLLACKKNKTTRMRFSSSALVFLSRRVPRPGLAAHGEALWL